MRRFSNVSKVGNIAIASVTVVALCSGAWLLRSGAETHAPPQPSAAQASTDRPMEESPAAPALPHSPPDRIRIPSIHVNAPLMGLGLTPQGSLDVPPAAKKNLMRLVRGGHHPR